VPLALLSFGDLVLNPWVFIPSLIFAIPILQTVMQPFTARIKAGERERLRRMYERLAMEKLDVIKTALTMGYKQDDLSELDARLEAVIGSDAMQRLLEGKTLPGGGKGSGKGSGSGTVIGINIQTSGKDEALRSAGGKVVDLDELMHSELADGLRQRQRQRDRE
jgi:hypothetical protein